MNSALDSPNRVFVLYIEDWDAEFPPRWLEVARVNDLGEAIKLEHIYKADGSYTMLICVPDDQDERGITI
jgi:hypothetical protein